MTIRIEPKPGARMRLYAKKAGEEAFEPADLEVLFEKVPGEDPEPYERLLGDAIAGDHQLFTRQDAIEETWRVVQPLLDEPGPVHPYEPGTWGPEGGRRADPRHRPVVRALAALSRRADSTHIPSGPC